MTERGDRHAGGEVDVHPALLVPDARTLAAHRDERRRREARDHQLVEHRARDRQRRGRAGGAARVPAGSDAVEVEGTLMSVVSYCAAMTWISIL